MIAALKEGVPNGLTNNERSPPKTIARYMLRRRVLISSEDPQEN
jgi:hypothetical protein